MLGWRRAVGLLAVTFAASGAASASAARTVAVSVTPSGSTPFFEAYCAPEGVAREPVISARGRYVVFESCADGLIEDDATRPQSDLYLRDIRRRAMRLVSVNVRGRQSRESNLGAAISADARLVAFWSFPRGVPGERDRFADVFVRDRGRRTTRKVSVSRTGRGANSSSRRPAISASGRYVAFSSFASNLVRRDRNRRADIFVRDRARGTTRLVSVSSSERQADGSSFWAAISAGGRYVAFASKASNLVPGDTNGIRDVFVRDRRRGVTSRVNVSSAGEQANHGSSQIEISRDGRFVAFMSRASNLVPGDTNVNRAGKPAVDIFVRDTRTAATQRVSVSAAGQQGNRSSRGTAMSADGRYVAFASAATNLMPGRDANGHLRDLFVRDLRAGTIRRLGISRTGGQGNRGAHQPALSADGRFIAFVSDATNLARRDRNNARDVFRYGPLR